MCKELVLLRDVITVYHPFYKKPYDKKKALARPRDYNIEHLIEQTMAYVGGYKFVDGSLFDFSDKSEGKTASIAPSPKNTSSAIFGGRISGIMTSGGNVKIGSIRTIIYNPHMDNLRYVFLPKDAWDPHMREFGDAHKKSIRFNWNKNTDLIPKFSGFECCNFEELARARG
jgi:hypothetical protein